MIRTLSNVNHELYDNRRQAASRILVTHSTQRHRRVPTTRQLRMFLRQLTIRPNLRNSRTFFRVHLVTSRRRTRIRLTILIRAIKVIRQPTRSRVNLNHNNTQINRTGIHIRLNRLTFKILNMIQSLNFVHTTRQYTNTLSTTRGTFLFLRQHTVPTLSGVTSSPRHLVTTVHHPHQFITTKLRPSRHIRNFHIIKVKINQTVTGARRITHALHQHSEFTQYL